MRMLNTMYFNSISYLVYCSTAYIILKSYLRVYHHHILRLIIRFLHDHIFYINTSFTHLTKFKNFSKNILSVSIGKVLS